MATKTEIVDRLEEINVRLNELYAGIGLQEITDLSAEQKALIKEGKKDHALQIKQGRNFNTHVKFRLVVDIKEVTDLL